jgi:hypothetical protein
MLVAGAVAVAWMFALRRRQPGALWALGAIALTVALLYGPSLRYGFVTDDFYFARPLSAAQVASTFHGNWEPLGQGNAHYRPLIAVAFQLDVLLWGPRPLGFHLTNLVVMAGLGLLAFALLRRLGAGETAALLGALAWIAHPLAATAACWTSERTDSIMAVFYLAALLALLAEPFRAREALAALACALLALGSKEMAATLPVAGALVLLAAPPRSARLTRLYTLLAMSALVGIYVLAWTSLFPNKSRLVLDGLGRKLAAALLPVFVPLAYEDAWQVRALLWLPFVLVAVIALGVLVTRRGPRAAGRIYWLGLAWTLVTLPPVFGLRDPDIHRLGLLVCFGAALMVAALALALPSLPRLPTPLLMAGALALLLVPPAVRSGAAWGPGGFAFVSGNGWKLRDPTWESRLSPDMRRLFRRQARQYLK